MHFCQYKLELVFKFSGLSANHPYCLEIVWKDSIYGIPYCISLVFGLDLKCLVWWQLLQLTCAAPTQTQKYLGKNTFIYLLVSPIDAGNQKCTQGTPSVKCRKNKLFEIGKLIFEIQKQVLCKHLWFHGTKCTHTNNNCMYGRTHIVKKSENRPTEGELFSRVG